MGTKRSYRQINMTAMPNKYPQKQFKKKGCRWCKEEFEPQAPSHLFCSDRCKDRSCANSYYIKAYGITIGEVETMLDKQNHLCAICHTEGFKIHDGVWTKLNIDHSHDETKTVRGALCHNCNRGLGLFKDSIENLMSAVSYLKGATTISQESTYKCTEAHNIER